MLITVEFNISVLLIKLSFLICDSALVSIVDFLYLNEDILVAGNNRKTIHTDTYAKRNIGRIVLAPRR